MDNELASVRMYPNEVFITPTEKIKLCKKISFLQDHLLKNYLRFPLCKKEELPHKNISDLRSIHSRLLNIRQKQILSANKEKAKEYVENIVEELYQIYYTDKTKCFVFDGEYINTDVVELVKYEDEELWEIMIPKHIEDFLGKYNVYVYNVMRYNLYRVYIDKIGCFRNVKRNKVLLNYFCDINFTLSVYFFYDCLKKYDIPTDCFVFKNMNMATVQDFNRYVEKHGIDPD